MGKRSRRERAALTAGQQGHAVGPATRTRRLLTVAALAFAAAVAAVLVARSRTGADSSTSFTRAGRNGPVFTIGVPRARVADDQYLLRVAEQLSSEEVQAGGSGQVSVMVWPDDVPVPREPPATEFDASMKTQAAGIFINPKRNIKHMIRFKNGATQSEREFGDPPR